MRKAMKKVILHVLVWIPISSISFAAQAALRMDFVNDNSVGISGPLGPQDPRPPQGPHESAGG